MRTSFRLARRRRVVGLGWLSLAVGAAQVVAPRVVGKLVGVRAPRRVQGLIRLLGVRGLLSGLGLLSRGRAGRWLKARIAGDLIDFGLLRKALRQPGARRARTAGALLATWGLALYDARTSLLARRDALALASAPVRRSITIARPAAAIFRMWRDFSHLSDFFPHVDFVDVIDEQTSRWRVRGATGDVLEWETVIVEERPDELLRWKSVDRASVATSGVLQLVPAPGGRGTEVHLEVQYHPPGGAVGRIIASLWSESPEQELDAALRRLKQRLETGGVVHADGLVWRET
jgi:uncharacterized membrane protein